MISPYYSQSEAFLHIRLNITNIVTHWQQSLDTDSGKNPTQQ
jgi:hypothetical protein